MKRASRPLVAGALIAGLMTVAVPGPAPAEEPATWSGTFTTSFVDVVHGEDNYTSTTRATVTGTVEPDDRGTHLLEGSLTAYSQTWHEEYPGDTQDCQVTYVLPVPVSATMQYGDQDFIGVGPFLDYDETDPRQFTPNQTQVCQSTAVGEYVFEEDYAQDLALYLMSCRTDEPEDEPYWYGILALGEATEGGTRFDSTFQRTCEYTYPASGVTETVTVNTTVDLTSEETPEADLSATVAGLASKTVVGKVDGAKATITNNGPDTARDVELRFGTPDGTFYTEITKPGGGWTCDQSTLSRVICRVDSLASGESATLKFGLLATDTERQTKLAVRALSSTPDPDETDNRDEDYQRIAAAGRPRATIGKGGPPSAGSVSARAGGEVRGRSWPAWYPAHNNDQRWLYTAKNMWCTNTGSKNDEGYIAATVYIWEQGDSKVERFEMKRSERVVGLGGVSTEVRRKTYDSGRFAPGGQWASITQVWPKADFPGYDSHILRAKWTWIRHGVHRNWKKQWDLVNC